MDAQNAAQTLAEMPEKVSRGEVPPVYRENGEGATAAVYRERRK